MNGAEVLNLAASTSLGILSLAFILTIIRIIRGPSLPDRILALDMLVSIGIGYIAAVAVKTSFFLYLDVAIALGLVGFLATVAFARYVLHMGRQSEGEISTKEVPEND
jgi:multicomponent Na+:H+ antiporter subunit F